MANQSYEKPVKGYPGLYTYGKENDHYRIKKSVKGIPLNKRFGKVPLDEAIMFYNTMVDAARNGRMFQDRPKYTIAQLTQIYKDEMESRDTKLRTWHEIVRDLDRTILPNFGHIIAVELTSNHVKAFVKKWRFDKNGKERKRATIVNQLANLTRVLNYAWEEGVDPVTQLSYLQYEIKVWRPPLEEPTEEEQLLIDAGELEAPAAEPYTLSQREELALLSKLPPEYRIAARFILYTGLRTINLRKLRWSQETELDNFDESVFMIPGAGMKNKRPWMLVLNSVARDILEGQRGKHPEFVFTNCHNQFWKRLYTTTWMKAWREAGLPSDNPNIMRGPHNLRHTFGERLRAAGVSEQDQDDLLAHWDSSIRRKYAKPKPEKLLEASEKVVQATSLKLVKA